MTVAVCLPDGANTIGAARRIDDMVAEDEDDVCERNGRMLSGLPRRINARMASSSGMRMLVVIVNVHLDM